PGTLEYSGYAEGFYRHSFVSDSKSKQFPFIYGYPDNRIVQLNHVQLEGRFRSGDWFGVAGVHTGRYVDENYAAEPAWVRPVFSASMGYALTPSFAIEAGIFSSHIGFESAIGKDGWTLSRSLMADNSPFYESGVKLIYSASPELTFTGLLLNGWQAISDSNTDKAVGTQIVWTPSDRFMVNSSTFIGNEQPNLSSKKMRYFHDLYAVWTLSDQLRVAPMLDAGVQENGAGGWDSWGGAAVLAQANLYKDWRVGGRIEWYSDPNAVVTSGAESVLSASLNVDHDLNGQVLWRNELKTYWGSVSDFEWITALSLSVNGKGQF
ncbi:porin, partial [bacterium]|nr:porin [bacterium]